MKRILITGPQGSGKSTQAEILAKKLGVGLINAGEMIRHLALENNEESRSLRNDLEKGKLVDDKVSARLVEKMAEKYRAGGFVADGYPRDPAQLKIFDPDYDKVFFLDISDEEAVKRLIGRGREDDTPEAIAERLKLYHKVTEPLLAYYQNQGKLIRIDGNGSVEEIARQIEEEVKSD